MEDCNELFKSLLEQNSFQGIFLLALKCALIGKNIVTESEWNEFLLQGAKEAEEIIKTKTDEINKKTVEKGIAVSEYLQL